MNFTLRFYFFMSLLCSQFFLQGYKPAGNANQKKSSLTPVGLLCEHRTSPMGIDVANPQLEWTLQPASPSLRGLTQTAYQVIVASSPEALKKNEGDLWNSGKVLSDQTTRIIYKGKPLSSHQQAWWKVRVWDGDGVISSWSHRFQWTMGILQKQDWSGARWIGAPERLDSAVNSTVLLRRDFGVKPGLRRAVVSICGLGQYEMTLNGKQLTETLLNPGWTQYDKTCLYDTYDITTLLNSGENAVGLLLSNGMYRVKKGGRYAKFEHSFGRLQAIAKMRLEYKDGTVQTLVTDATWKAGESPMTWSSIYGG
ncbi:MAG TPA: alpha-L-rhamnosidase N-terminal domain-containing protein, partial [Flavisolibacter sp.]|nr:alpha-L-rhamnosidase N-terminal domain-containing protein [Flavisolibacter sp.]